ncbi:hypothetical protein ACFLZO_00820 [Patescibacteria group bacterium]
MRHVFHRHDLIWVLAFPVYQIIGTIRHEASHALVVLAEGGTVLKFVFWPTWHERFYWGYVQWSGSASWLVSAAPYLIDLLTFAVFYLICTKVAMRRHWVWVNVYMIGLISPLVNSGYRYISNFFRTGDLTSVMTSVPPRIVHAYFILTLFAYGTALLWIQYRKDRAVTT